MIFDVSGLVRNVPLQLYDCARHELAILICTAGREPGLLLKNLHHIFGLTSTPFPTLFPILVDMPHGSSWTPRASKRHDTKIDFLPIVPNPPTMSTTAPGTVLRPPAYTHVTFQLLNSTQGSSDSVHVKRAPPPWFQVSTVWQITRLIVTSKGVTLNIQINIP